MPFLRFSRDKRGYEHTYLVHAANRRGRPTRPRVLYWYRTPPGVKVGRAPFDDEMRKRLELQYPGVTFDWKTYESTPMPQPEPEYWRERRRAERAARQARQLDDPEAAVEEAEAPGPEVEAPVQEAEAQASPADVPTIEAGAPEFPLRVRRGDVSFSLGEAAAVGEGPLVESGTSAAGIAPGAAGVAPLQRERRRRRRGGRRRHARPAPPAAGGVATTPAGSERTLGKLDEVAGNSQGPNESDPE